MNTRLSTDQLNRPDKVTFGRQQKIPVVVVLEDIRSRNNVGSVFRSADAFAIQEIILCGYTACPPHRDIQKTALGATETVRWRYIENIDDAISEFKKKNYSIQAVEQTTASIDLIDFPFRDECPVMLILGNEVSGISDAALKMCDGTIEIAQYGTKHSLNVAVCAGIVMHQANYRLMHSS